MNMTQQELIDALNEFKDITGAFFREKIFTSNISVSEMVVILGMGFVEISLAQGQDEKTFKNSLDWALKYFINRYDELNQSQSSHPE